MGLRKPKKKTGPAPADPVGGSKTIQVIMKMNALEVGMAAAVAQSMGVPRAEMLRRLMRERFEQLSREKESGQPQPEAKAKKA